MNQKAINFFELLDYNQNGIKIDKIVIPEIQRDYVQGRTSKSESEVRKSLIGDILNTLKTGEEMELYFIYGKIEVTEKGNLFTPLDGQQRLTTLFLLYWYLSSKKEDLNKIRIKLSDNEYVSRFSYETRDYSKNFIDNLVKYSVEDIVADYESEYEKNDSVEPEKKWTLSKSIKDKNWFGFSWAADPTVQAMLTMLDFFEEKINKSLMTDSLENFGKIKFFFLNLGDFGMTDKLYVKMNDRGKDLSDFDYTKSTFSGDVFSITQDVNKSNELWDGNFDNHWMDCFWKLCFNTQNLFDKDFKTDGLTKGEIDDIARKNTVSRVERVYSRFINKIILLYISEKNIYQMFTTEAEKKVYEKYYSSDKDIVPDIYDLTNLISSQKKFLHQVIRNNSFKNFYSFFNSVMTNFFYSDENGNIYPITTLLNDYVSFPEYSNFDYILNNEKLQIDEFLLFASVINFVLTTGYSASETSVDPIKQEAFKEWVLFCRDMLSRDNTFIDNVDVFLNMNNCLYEWSLLLGSNNWSLKENIENLSLTFANSYLETQLLEEKEKYEISKKYPSFFNDIRIFENQRYYLGQVQFLIDMSKNNDIFDINLFQKRIEQLNSIFIHDGNEYRIVNVNLLRQVMLCYGDWTLDFYPRKCFCRLNFNRDYSWKSFFRKSNNYQFMKSMLDDWFSNDPNSSFEDFANKKVDEAKNSNLINDWRKYFINNGAIFEFMNNSIMCLKNENRKEYLLLRSSTYLTGNSNYGDLFTVSLFFSQNGMDKIGDYVLSDRDFASYNEVTLAGRNGEKIIIKSQDVNNEFKYDVIIDTNQIYSKVDQNIVEQYLNNIL
ncbi:MAG: DUF262 domain-containing protein [Treponema sp.]|nr:DUF262 domain-containing protein [Candidatus Treponema merdequi]